MFAVIGEHCQSSCFLSEDSIFKGRVCRIVKSHICYERKASLKVLIADRREHFHSSYLLLEKTVFKARVCHQMRPSSKVMFAVRWKKCQMLCFLSEESVFKGRVCRHRRAASMLMFATREHFQSLRFVKIDR